MTRIQPGSIVVAVDGSPASERAVLWAAEQAHLERRRLVVVTAVPEGTSEASEAAVELARHWRPGIEVAGATIDGPPREVLHELSLAAHLLVVGSRGRGPVESAVLGSVSASVARHAGCPVVVCRPGSVGRVHRGILVGAEATPTCGTVLEFAFHQASLRDVPLTIVGDGNDAGAAAAALSIAEATAGFAELFPEVRVTVEPDSVFADECDGPSSWRWDMIVVGRAGRGTIRHSATQMLERSRTVVAVVPETSDDELVRGCDATASAIRGYTAVATTV
ncbi:universal stress protein [Nocardioides ultimimeridianus]